jgi:hypothetical protein
MPAPIKPTLKSQYAPAPAKGRSASAASRAVEMVVAVRVQRGG